MAVRDARPTDLPRLAELVGTSEHAARGLLRERTVRVFVDGAGEVSACLAFDADETAVSITRLAGEPACFDELLDEAVSFAAATDLPVEMVVLEDERAVREALEAAGFAAVAGGPPFDGRTTTRFRREPGPAR